MLKSVPLAGSLATKLRWRDGSAAARDLAFFPVSDLFLKAFRGKYPITHPKEVIHFRGIASDSSEMTFQKGR